MKPTQTNQTKEKPLTFKRRTKHFCFTRTDARNNTFHGIGINAFSVFMFCGCTDGHGTREHGAERTRRELVGLVFSGTYATDEHTIEIELELCSRCDLSDRIWSRSGSVVVLVVVVGRRRRRRCRNKLAIQFVRVVWERESESE